AYPSTLIALCQRAIPPLVDEVLRLRPLLTAPGESAAIRQLYARLPALDFSRSVLTARPASLVVLPVTGVAWCDLGEPRRVLAMRDGVGATRARPGRSGTLSA